ncbi:MAG: DUF484 family protein [Cellvibrionales bacterium TMED148]|nr:hypothetical protein [Porticoccaceae bacterium]RPG90830.1 MAG: DUF484 family protein [Cellvibrionales bacterium TMED148]
MKHETKEQIKKKLSDFLRENPTYLYDNPDILENLYLPHSTGSAVSLVERQVGLLRERNSELRSRLNILNSKAEENELLLEKTQSLILKLLDAKSLSKLTKNLMVGLKNDFSVEFYSLILFGAKQNTAGARFSNYNRAEKEISSILKSDILCGAVRENELKFLFGKDSLSIGSIAAIVIKLDKPLAVLSIAHRDANFYTPETGTMFLSYLGNVLNHLLGSFLKSESSFD